MAYNTYFPQFYQPNQFMPQQVQAPIMPQTQQTNSGFNWVRNGEAGANAYPVAPGRSELLMDTDNPVFYIKTVDQSGMPMPLRIFDYSERKSPNSEVKEAKPTIQTDKFVSRDEFENFRDEIKEEIKKFNKPQTPIKKSTAKEE